MVDTQFCEAALPLATLIYIMTAMGRLWLMILNLTWTKSQIKLGIRSVNISTYII